jgi:hypothetical protein
LNLRLRRNQPAFYHLNYTPIETVLYESSYATYEVIALLLGRASSPSLSMSPIRKPLATKARAMTTSTARTIRMPRGPLDTPFMLITSLCLLPENVYIFAQES